VHRAVTGPAKGVEKAGPHATSTAPLEMGSEAGQQRRLATRNTGESGEGPDGRHKSAVKSRLPCRSSTSA
jgi:hypothetical protein